MKKILFSVCLVVFAASADAQSKIAYINSQSIMEQLPEAQDAQ